MTNEQPITIDADTARRMALNMGRNPRAVYDPVKPTDSHEATQTLNPITGRPYADGNFRPESEKRRIKNDLEVYQDLLEFQRLKPKKTSKYFGPRTNQEIELQKALGRMEVRDGNLGDYAFGEFLDDVEALADLYAQNPDLTLESITDVIGLNAALGPFETERMIRKIQPKLGFYSFDSLIKPEIDLSRMGSKKPAFLFEKKSRRENLSYIDFEIRYPKKDKF